MQYENPDVPHEVNVSKGNSLSEFARLALGMAALIALVGAATYFGGGRLARLVPFATERSWVGERVVGISVKSCDPHHAEIEAYLQRLGNELAGRMGLPPGMTVTVHYTDDDTPNAFATLGGHLVVTSGLYGRMPSENALAMVLGHEIGHVKARDPISAVGGSAAMSMVVVLLSGQGDILGPQVARAVQLGYSRKAERDADDLGLAALLDKYGHAGGAPDVFRVLADFKGDDGAGAPTLLSTHPSDAERIARLERAALGWGRSAAPLRPIEVPPQPMGRC